MWYKKGGELPAGKTKLENFNKALRISNVSEEDSGEYFCLASNKMGSIRHTISVRVKGTSPLPCHLLHSHSQKLRGASVVLGASHVGCAASSPTSISSNPPYGQWEPWAPLSGCICSQQTKWFGLEPLGTIWSGLLRV